MYTILRIGRRPRGEQSRAWDEGLGHQQKSGATGSCGATAECSCRAELRQPVGPPVTIHFHIPVLDGAYRLKRVFAIEWLEMSGSMTSRVPSGTRSGLPLPAGVAERQRSLEYYESLRFPYAPAR
jgi:hypothetical protein